MCMYAIGTRPSCPFVCTVAIEEQRHLINHDPGSALWLLSLVHVPSTNEEKAGCYDLYCRLPPGGDGDALASLLVGAVMLFIYLYTQSMGCVCVHEQNVCCGLLSSAPSSLAISPSDRPSAHLCLWLFIRESNHEVFRYCDGPITNRTEQSRALYWKTQASCSSTRTW